ncbi:MAG: HEAT repeat domain-containing protein, partial [Deltaproteobacteria bacterium]|nr:HEAT repeat domain-containing protein [Deltaproteobacteria bacterium]
VIGPAAASAAPALIRLSKTGEGWKRAAAVRALGQIGTAHPKVLPALTRMLKVKDRRGERHLSVQQCAVDALGAIGPEAGHLAPRIAKMFVKENLANKYALETAVDVYAEVLTSLDPSGESWIDVFVRALKRGAHRDNGEIMPLLTDAGKSAGRAAPEIAKIFRDDDDDTHHASGILESLGSAAAEAVPTLIEVVEDEERDVWDHIDAIQILGAIGSGASTALPALESSLDSEYESVRFEASVAIARIKGEPVPRKSVNELIEPLGERRRLDNEDLEALAALGPQALDAAPRLIELLGSGDSYTRKITAESIVNMVKIQPEPAGALPQLVAQVICEIDHVHWDAATVLARLGPAVARLAPFLTVAFEEADDGERQAAAWALSNLGAGAAPVRPALMEVLSCDAASEELWETRRYVMESIAAIGARPEDSDRLLALLECVPSEEKDTRIAAIRAVASVGASGRERILPTLERLMRDEEGDVGRAAGAGVGGLGAETLPLLIELLDGDSHEVRMNALAGIEAMGADASSSLGRLLELAGAQADDYTGSRQARAIADVICAMGDGTIAALRQELRRGGVPEQHRVVLVMGYMFERTAEVVPLLVEALDDENPEVREAVIEALGRSL